MQLIAHLSWMFCFGVLFRKPRFYPIFRTFAPFPKRKKTTSSVKKQTNCIVNYGKLFPFCCFLNSSKWIVSLMCISKFSGSYSCREHVWSWGKKRATKWKNAEGQIGTLVLLTLIRLVVFFLSALCTLGNINQHFSEGAICNQMEVFEI